MESNQLFSIRKAVADDVPLILQFILDLAEYEQLRHEVVTDEDTLRTWIFERHGAEVLIAQEGDEPVGFALYFHNFSTFLGRCGIYLEDLFVRPEHRGKGYGLALMVDLCTAVMSGGLTSPHMKQADGEHTCHCFWAMDYGIFGDKAAQRQAASQLLQELRYFFND